MTIITIPINDNIIADLVLFLPRIDKLWNVCKILKLFPWWSDICHRRTGSQIYEIAVYASFGPKFSS